MILAKYEGSEYCWSDGSRDLLCVIDEVRDTHLPLVVIGHSMGAAQAVYASVLRPRLFAAIIAIEPVMYDTINTDLVRPILALAKKRHRFQDTKELRTLQDRPYFRSWDPRAFEAFVKHSCVSESDQSLELKTSPLQETITYLDRSSSPQAYSQLPYVTDPVVYINGLDSNWNPKGSNEGRAKATRGSLTVGIRPGGHMCPLENIDGTAMAICSSLQSIIPLRQSARNRRINRTMTTQDEIMGKINYWTEKKASKL